MTPHDDLATLLSVAESLDAERMVGSASDIREAVKRVEAELARLEELNEHDWREELANRIEAAEAALAEMTKWRDEAEGLYRATAEHLRHNQAALEDAYSDKALMEQEITGLGAAIADTRRALEEIAAYGNASARSTPEKDIARRALAASEPTGPTEERCPVPGCTLPKGHNRGRADIPENHRKAIGPTEEQT